MGGPFCTSFLQEPFLHGFCPPKKQKRTLTDFRRKMTKISDFVFFIWLFFLQKKRKICLFLFISDLSLHCPLTARDGCNPKFSTFFSSEIRECPFFRTSENCAKKGPCKKGPSLISRTIPMWGERFLDFCEKITIQTKSRFCVPSDLVVVSPIF